MLGPKMKRNSHLNPIRLIGDCFAAFALFLSVPFANAQEAPVTGQIEVLKPGAKTESAAANRVKSAANTAVWLTPLGDGSGVSNEKRSHAPNQLLQRNKSFEPHILVVEVGTVVQFPNKDPFFHNVFSLFDGKRFDLGLYEAGSSNSVHFDRPGISYLFCNIHPEMSAVVLAVPTSYFAVADAAGRWAIPHVPNGHYRLHVWYERSSEEDLAKLQRDIVISDANRTLETVRVVDNPTQNPNHKNKYGKDYVPAATPAYSNP
jgi:plastocyanin